MDEYISREFMLKNLEVDKANNAEHCEPLTIQIMDRFIRYIREFPSADVQPIKHGRWIPQGDDMWLCSNCKENIIYSMSKSDRTEKQRYCCRCGARMDLKDGDVE